MIDQAQHIKENLQIEERLTFLYYDDFHLGTDIEPEYLKQLVGVLNKIEGSGTKLI